MVTAVRRSHWMRGRNILSNGWLSSIEFLWNLSTDIRLTSPKLYFNRKWFKILFFFFSNVAFCVYFLFFLLCSRLDSLFRAAQSTHCQLMSFSVFNVQQQSLIYVFLSGFSFSSYWIFMSRIAVKGLVQHFGKCTSWLSCQELEAKIRNTYMSVH